MNHQSPRISPRSSVCSVDRRTARLAAVLAALLLLVVPLLAPTGAAAQEDDLGTPAIRVFAGTGDFGFSGDGGPAVDAQFIFPTDLAVGPAGNAYIADFFNFRIRRVDPSGTVTTVVGSGGTVLTGGGGFSGDGGPATEALLNRPNDVAVADDGTLYIADVGNHRIRKVTPGGDGVVTGANDEIITTIAGTGEAGFNGDDQPATDAQLNFPEGVSLNPDGTLYIADAGNNRVRKIDNSGTITTVAGTGVEGFDGDGGPATDAQMDRPERLAFNEAGNLYITDSDNKRIRKVDASSGTITTVAGNDLLCNPGNVPDYPTCGDGGPAVDAPLANPTGLAVDDNGDVLIGDTGVERIRKVDVSSGTITTVAGTTSGGVDADELGDGVAPTETPVAATGLTVDEDRGLLIADRGRHRLFQVDEIPDLVAVSKTASTNPVRVGEPMDYTVEVSNPGLAGPASNVQLSDPLPDGMAFESVDAPKGTCSQTGGEVSCQFGQLAEGETVPVTVTVTPTEAQIVDNTATVTVDGEDPYTRNNESTVKSLVTDKDCGKQVTEDFTLTEDIGPCPGNGLEVAADGVTIDMNGHSLIGWRGYEGFAYGEFRGHAEQPDEPALSPLNTGREVGIAVIDRHDVTVEGGGTVTGFAAGVMLAQGSSGNTIQNLTVTENDGVNPRDAILGDGIVLFNSPGNVIADNDVVRNATYDGIGVWGPDSDNNEITGNLVADTPALRGTSRVWGIMVNGASGHGDGTTITGAVIANNTVRNNGSHGISNVNSFDAKVVNNLVEDNGLGPEGFARGIAVSTGAELQEADTGVRIAGNTVRNNGRHGIQANARGVRIVNNTSTDNSQKGEPGVDFFDLHDATGSDTCEYNVWNNNRWGSAGYSPECTSKRGLGKGKNPAANASPQQQDVEPPVRQPPEFANDGR